MNYPIYKLHADAYYCFISDTQFIQVTSNNGIGGPEVGMFDVEANYKRILSKGVTVLEDAFMIAYNDAWHELNKKIFAMPELSLNHQLSPGLPQIYY